MQLSRREKQVARLVSLGMLNKEIAYELDIHEGTVKRHLHGLFRKTGCSNRIELIRKVLLGGLLDPELTDGAGI